MGLEQISVRVRCKMPAKAVQVKLRRGKKAARSTIDNGSGVVVDTKLE